MWKKQNTHSSISQVRKTIFQREKSIKLLVVLLDQQLTRTEHIKRTGKIIAKIHRYM